MGVNEWRRQDVRTRAWIFHLSFGVHRMDASQLSGTKANDLSNVSLSELSAAATKTSDVHADGSDWLRRIVDLCIDAKGASVAN